MFDQICRISRSLSSVKSSKWTVIESNNDYDDEGEEMFVSWNSEKAKKVFPPNFQSINLPYKSAGIGDTYTKKNSEEPPTRVKSSAAAARIDNISWSIFRLIFCCLALFDFSPEAKCVRTRGKKVSDYYYVLLFKEGPHKIDM